MCDTLTGMGLPREHAMGGSQQTVRDKRTHERATTGRDRHQPAVSGASIFELLVASLEGVLLAQHCC